MVLEDLLSPIKWVDEQLLTQYTRLAGKIEGTKRDKHIVALGLTFAGFYIAGLSPENPEVLAETITSAVQQNPLISVAFIPAIAYAGLALHDMGHSIYKSIHKNQETLGEIAIDRFDYLTKKVQKASRLPLWGSGTFLLFEFGRAVYESGISDLSSDTPAMILGIAFASLASSMYLKDSNPKLLQKKPFWESAYEWIKEKTSLMIPLPQPVHAYSALEMGSKK